MTTIHADNVAVTRAARVGHWHRGFLILACLICPESPHPDRWEVVLRGRTVAVTTSAREAQRWIDRYIGGGEA